MGQLVAERESIDYQTIKKEIDEELDDIFFNFLKIKVTIARHYCNFYKKNWEHISAVLPEKDRMFWNEIFESEATKERTEFTEYYAGKLVKFSNLIKRDTKGLTNVVDSLHFDIHLAWERYHNIIDMPEDKTGKTIRINELLAVMINLEDLHAMSSTVLKLHKIARVQNKTNDYDKLAQLETRKISEKAL